MSLNRNQATLSAIGGVFAVGAAVLGWLLWSAVGESNEALADRDSSMSAIDSFYSAKVFPSAESLEAVKANTDEIAGWRENAKIVASRGDKKFAETTPPSFKQFLQSEQVRLSSLPGKAAGRICQAGFAFGFDKYLGQNPTMPEKADLPKLQRQLDFIAEAIELFAESGVAEVKSVKRDETPAAAVVEEVPQARPAKKGKKGGRADLADEGPVATSLVYSFQFLASPDAFVRTLNRLSADFRFIVVESLDFTESRDVISENFAAREKAEMDAKSAKSSRRTRQHRRKGDEDPELADESAKPADSGLVIDPEIDAPLLVDISVRVFDFGQGIEVAEPAPEAPAPAPEAPAPEAPAPEAPAPAAAAAPAPEAPAPETPAPAFGAEAAAPEGEAKEESAK